MQKLKLLPWLARRHGVAPDRAAELWCEAIALADFRHGASPRTGAYYAYAMRTLLRLLRCEGVALVEPLEVEQPRVERAAGSAVLLIDSQRRLGAVAFDAAEAFLHAANEYWSCAVRVANARR
jgi:hypothetical protein